MSNPHCILRDKQFKDTAKSLNISEDLLEDIVHDYQLKNDTDAFPSDEYILSKLEGTNNEYSKEAMQLWSDSFSTPLTFDTLEGAQMAFTEASKYFPEEAIKLYETNDGKYKISVTAPNVEKEYEAIKKEAIKNGTFMKAPNGKDANYYEGNITPDSNTIFVFGSNPEGRHGAGAAKTAKEQFGAKYGIGEGLTGNAYALPTKDLRGKVPFKRGRMTFSYGNNKRSGVKSTTTFEAIKNGERTATTRYTSDGHIEYWKSLRKGDIVEFSNANNETVLVEITKPLTKLDSNNSAEEWSKKEGWSVDYYNNKVLPKIQKGEAFQFEYKVVDSKNTRSISPSQIIESIKKLYDTARKNPNKQFKVAYRNTDKASLNGYTGLEMIDMFKEAGEIPSNVLFSKEWVDTGKFNQANQSNELTNTQFPSKQKTPSFNKDAIDSSKVEISESRSSYISLRLKNPSEGMTNAEVIIYTPEEGSNNHTIVFDGITEDNDSRGNFTQEELKEWNTLLSQVREVLPEGATITLSTDEGNMSDIPYLEKIAKEWGEPVSTEVIGSGKTAFNAPVFQKPSQQQMTELEKFANVQNVISKQVYNLLNSKLFTATALNELTNDIAFEISDLITQLLEDPTIAKQLFGDLVSVDAVSKATTRTEIINAVGWDNLTTYVKNLYKQSTVTDANGNTFPKFTSVSTIRKANEIQKNWDAIMQLCISRFKVNEGVSVVNDGVVRTTEVEQTEINNNSDDFNAEDVDTIIEEYGTLQEGWQIDSKTKSAIDTMSSQVKTFLNGRPKLKIVGYDEAKNPITETVKNEFGGTSHHSLTEVTSNLLNWFRGTQTINDMITVLKTKSITDPWVNDLITILSDTSGKYSYFQNEFFTTMYRPFQEYDVISFANGTYSAKPINRANAANDVVTSIKAQITLNQHPLFTSTGLNATSLKQLNTAADTLEAYVDGKNKDLSREELLNTIGKVYNILGFNASPEMIAKAINNNNIKTVYEALDNIIAAIQKHPKDREYKPFEYNDGNNKDYITGYFKTLISPVIDIMDSSALKSFYDSGKMYQSYVIPSYMTNLFTKFKDVNDATFNEFIEKEYGQYEWFKEAGTDLDLGWRNSWLRQLVLNKKAREVFAHKVNLNMNKKNYMKTMSDLEYTASIIIEYFSENERSRDTQVPAWFRLPILSNKPSSEFIRFYSERGADYKETLVSKMKEVFLQEVSRIQTTRRRNRTKADADFIKNWDTNGRKFQFLDFLNDYLDGSQHNSELGKLLNKQLEGTKELTSEESVTLDKLIEQSIFESIQQKVDDTINQFKSNGLLEYLQGKIKGINKGNVVDKVENMLWNDKYAQMMIQELLITDPAFYKDSDDIQKRIAQVHAPGIRPNINAKDQYGNVVSDGIQRNIVFTDIDGVMSSAIKNLEAVFDKKIEEAPESMKEQWRAIKEAVIDEYSNINATDAQAYTSPSGYRKKAIMFGKWNSTLEDAYQRIKDGTYTYDDLKIAFQPLKPFMYSQNAENMNTDNVPLSKHKVPVQNKNAEYMLIMADALLRGEHTEQPNLLGVLFDIMEESHTISIQKGKIASLRQDGIDTMQFNSAVKSGERGAISLRELLENKEGKDNVDWYAYAKSTLESKIYEDKGSHSYNMNHVNHSDYANYSIQQEVPAHYRDHEQAQSSQERYIGITDLVDTNPDGTPTVYKVNGRELSKQELKNEYEQAIADNIDEDIQRLRNDLQLDNPDPKVRNLAKSRLIQDEINSSPRYGMDLWLASCIDPNTGNFTIPEGDPIQSKRIEQLINSILKNRINKQTLPGGPVVQVTSFGTSKKLHIRYYDKAGNIIPTFEESGMTESEYKEYLKDNQEGVAHNEVYAPIPSQDFYDKFADSDGNIDMEAVEACSPELLYLISNRIPCQEKYGIERDKIVGFLPKEAGEAIMYPYDLTSKDDSDFDVDKRYIQHKHINIKMRKREELFQELLDYSLDFQKSKGKEFTKEQLKALKSEINRFLDNPQFMQKERGLGRFLGNKFRKIAYTAELPTQGRAARDNKVIDILSTVLSHPTQAYKVMTPGNFNSQKKMGYAVEAYRSGKYSWDKLMSMSISDLKALLNTNKNLTDLRTQIEYYRQNVDGSNILGIFAVQRVAQAVLEGDNFRIDMDNIDGIPSSLTIGGTTIDSSTPIHASTNSAGQSIGEIFGAHIGASADTAKEPVLSMNNINKETVNVFSTMIKMGVPYETAAMFMSSSVITAMLKEHAAANLKGSKSLNTIIKERLKELSEEFGGLGSITTEEVSIEEILESIRTPFKDIPLELEIKILETYNTLSTIADELKGLIYATRFNSISNAAGPLIIDNLIAEHKVNQFSNHILDSEGNSVDFYNVLEKHSILNSFFQTIDLADEIFGEMPANSTAFRGILNRLDSQKRYTGVANALYNDRTLLSKFSDFYQSYLLINNGIINPSKLNEMINKFPNRLVSENWKEKYPDNPFIQALTLKTTKSGSPYLNIDTTGLTQQEKDILSYGWLDIYNSGSEGRRLANELFQYAFFRRGIGFSPESFMSLFPLMMKINSKAYLDTYRNTPTIDEDIFIDQFIRNNADNNKLVPYRDYKNTVQAKFLVEETINGYKLSTVDKSAIRAFRDLSFFKTEIDGSTKIFKKIYSREGTVYVEVSSLGNNGEYLEISKENIKDSLVDTLLKESQSSDAIAEKEVNIEEESSIDDTDLDRARYQRLLDIFSKASDPAANIARWGEHVRKNERIKDLVKFLNVKLQERGEEITQENIEQTLKDLSLC